MRRRRPLKVTRTARRSTRAEVTNFRLLLLLRAAKGVKGSTGRGDRLPSRPRGTSTSTTSTRLLLLEASLAHHQHPNDGDDDEKDEGTENHEGNDDNPTLQTAAEGVVHVAGARSIGRRLQAKAKLISPDAEVVERLSISASPLNRLLHAGEDRPEEAASSQWVNVERRSACC